MTFYVPTPSNHNDFNQAFPTLGKAFEAAKDSYGDVYVKVYIVKDNKLADIEAQIDELIQGIE